MSLILKGIDIPKEGEWLSVIIKPTKEVIVDTIRYGDYALLNTEYGSAVQIPEGHGRLIDANKLFYEEVGKIKPRNDEHYKAIGEFMNMITNAPTIIEAEE